jgi:Lactate dehydrogenase and related dehydrogenases
MRSDAFLINTSRGGIVNEQALYEALSEGKIAGAALDVYEEEPYSGDLSKLDNILLTPHMGSCSYDCRAQMEIEATEEVIRFFQGEPLQNEVPEEEYLYNEIM